MHLPRGGTRRRRYPTASNTCRMPRQKSGRSSGLRLVTWWPSMTTGAVLPDRAGVHEIVLDPREPVTRCRDTRRRKSESSRRGRLPRHLPAASKIPHEFEHVSSRRSLSGISRPAPPARRNAFPLAGNCASERQDSRFARILVVRLFARATTAAPASINRSLVIPQFQVLVAIPYEDQDCGDRKRQFDWLASEIPGD